jgi:hypothetical protein
MRSASPICPTADSPGSSSPATPANTIKSIYPAFRPGWLRAIPPDPGRRRCAAGAPRPPPPVRIAAEAGTAATLIYGTGCRNPRPQSPPRVFPVVRRGKSPARRRRGRRIIKWQRLLRGNRYPRRGYRGWRIQWSGLCCQGGSNDTISDCLHAAPEPGHPGRGRGGPGPYFKPRMAGMDRPLLIPWMGSPAPSPRTGATRPW